MANVWDSLARKSPLLNVPSGRFGFGVIIENSICEKGIKIVER